MTLEQFANMLKLLETGETKFDVLASKFLITQDSLAITHNGFTLVVNEFGMVSITMYHSEKQQFFTITGDELIDALEKVKSLP
jgi:K+ transporter